MPAADIFQAAFVDHNSGLPDASPLKRKTQHRPSRVPRRNLKRVRKSGTARIVKDSQTELIERLLFS
jgi:hypothetical protein